MSKFIKLSDLKEGKLKDEEMKKTCGGKIELTVVIYGMYPPPW